METSPSSPTSTATCRRSKRRSRESRRSASTIYCGGDLVGYGPGPTRFCHLIEASRRSTATTTTRSPRRRGLRLRLRHPARPRARPALGRVDPRPHRPALQGLHARAAVRPALRAGRQTGPPRPRLAAQGQRVPLRGQAGPHLRADRRGADCDVLVFGHTHKPWIATYGGVLFVNCGSVGKPKDGDPRGAFAVLGSWTQGCGADRALRLRRRARLAEVAAAGLPGEFAEKLRLDGMPRGGHGAMKYVLFVCNQNAGRSQMAQAFFERHAPEDVRAESAGLRTRRPRSIRSWWRR